MSSRRFRVGQVLASARLAAWLIGAQLLFLIVSFIVPQRGIFPQEQVDGFLDGMPGLVAWFLRTLSLHHVFTSPVFYATAILLVLNLTACTIRRIVRRHASTAIARTTPSVPPNARHLMLTRREEAEGALAAVGAHEIGRDEAETSYYLRRGSLGFLGSIVLHLALVLVIAGGVVTSLTTFRGTMVFTEGQAHIDAPAEYLSVEELPKLGRGFGTFEVMLESMEFEYTQGQVVDAVAGFRIAEGERVRTERARVNYPLSVAGKSFLLKDAGHSVAITVTDTSGRVVIDSFVNLLGASKLGYRDSIALSDVQLRIVSRPERSRPLTEPVVNGLTLTAPVVGLSLAESDDADSYVWVTPGGESATLGQYTVTVHEVRIWNSFLVRADGGRYITYLAFLLIIIGSIVRFLDPDRWVRAILTEQRDCAELHVWGAQRYRADALPREAEQLLSALGYDSGDIHTEGDGR